MKKWQQCMTAAVLGTFGTICYANADDFSTANQPSTSNFPFYRTQELSIDAFGSGSIGQ